MQIKILNCIVFAVSTIFISGCDSPRSYDTLHVVGSTPIRHHGISPIYPAMNNGFIDRYQTTDTLTPELKWKDLKTTNQTYDVCIWETPYRSIKDIQRKEAQFESSWGISAYYTNNINTNFHRIAIPLKPDTYYNWSVRIRDGEKVENWSAFRQDKVEFWGVFERYNLPFGFKTPVQ